MIQHYFAFFICADLKSGSRVKCPKCSGVCGTETWPLAR